MSRPVTPNVREWTARVAGNRVRGGGYRVLDLDLPGTFPAPAAGAFIMMGVGDEPSILLRRPMAFYDRYRKGTAVRVEVLYAVVGRGTTQMTKLARGDEVTFLGPIGNQFSRPKPKEQVTVVAGGVGIAPFLLWGRQLASRQKKDVRLLLGFRNRDQLPLARDFRRVRLTPTCAVEQGGGDLRGTVIDLLSRDAQQHPPDRILTCGPNKMMERVISFARDRQIPCEVSLEAKMGCGVGVCLSCVTDLAPGERGGGYALVCQDGPIFTL